MKSHLFYLLVALSLVVSGCSITAPRAELPTKRQLVREQLTVHSDFYLPQQHRLIENLVSLRYEVTKTLELPTSDESIHVYLFENEKRFRAYLSKQVDSFPDRRAFFIKNDTQLKVLAFWGERVAEDLRHEVTHGYLHSVVPTIPLWLDEGLAEYFEVQPGDNAVNVPHLQLLAEAYREGKWQPDLARLEEIHPNDDLSQLEYAEAWLWAHFLLKRDAHTNKLICDTLSNLREFSHAPQLAPQVEAWIPDAKQAVVVHLKQLADRDF